MENIKSMWVIGNGFDIACNLPTQYRKFIRYYIDRESLDADILYFKGKINENISAWADLETQLGKATKLFTSLDAFMKCYTDIKEKLVEYLKGIDEEPDFSKIEVFFGSEKYGYIDIENTVFLVLNYTSYFEQFIKMKYPNVTTRVYYPHGNIVNNDIVLGIGAPGHIENFTYNKLLESKLIKQNIVDYTSFFPMHTFPDDIRLFGTSLGICDGRMWTQIINPLIVPESSSMIRMFFDLFLTLFHKPIRKNEKLTIYNLYSKNNLDIFRYNFATFNSAILFVNKRRFVRRANKRIHSVKYIDTITHEKYIVPTLSYKEYKEYIKFNPPWRKKSSKEKITNKEY